MQELTRSGEEICQNWGTKYTPKSKELAALLKSYFGRYFHYYISIKMDEPITQKLEHKIKSKIIPNPDNKLSRRETL